MDKLINSIDLQYNIAALTLAILREDIATAEQAFSIIERRKNRTVYNYKDTLDMIKMTEQGLTYDEIGEIYGISGDAVYGRIRRYKKRTNSDGNLKVQCK